MVHPQKVMGNMRSDRRGDGKRNEKEEENHNNSEREGRNGDRSEVLAGMNGRMVYLLLEVESSPVLLEAAVEEVEVVAVVVEFGGDVRRRLEACRFAWPAVLTEIGIIKKRPQRKIG